MTQEALSKWQKRQEAFARVRALILQILNKHPEGLTTQQVAQFYLFKYGYLPRIGNRLRELVKENLAERREVDGKIRFFVSSVEDTSHGM